MKEDFSGEGVTVGVESVGGEADKAITGNDGGSGEFVGFINDPCDASDDVHFAVVIDAGHLGGFSADEGAVDGSACFGGPGDNLVEDIAFESAASEIVEEIEGACSLAEDVVDAMVDDVVSEATVVAGHLRDDGFCPDSINRTDENGSFDAGELGVEHGTESADPAENIFVVGCGDGIADGIERSLGFVDIDSGVGVVLALIHGFCFTRGFAWA